MVTVQIYIPANTVQKDSFFSSLCRNLYILLIYLFILVFGTILFLSLSAYPLSGFLFSLEKKHVLLVAWLNLEIIKLHTWYKIQKKYAYKMTYYEILNNG